MPEFDDFAYVLPVDYTLHTPENLFCYDPACPCHEDADSIAQVADHVQNGLMTPQEATDLVEGKGL